MNILLFLLDNVKYGIEIHYCKEIDYIEHITYIDLKNEAKHKNYVEGITNLRGEIITVINLKRLLFYANNTDNNRKSYYLILLNMKKKKLGLLVDEVLDIVNISKENINTSKGSIDHNISQFIKFSVLYNHEPILLLNPENL